MISRKKEREQRREAREAAERARRHARDETDRKLEAVGLSPAMHPTEAFISLAERIKHLEEERAREKYEKARKAAYATRASDTLS